MKWEPRFPAWIKHRGKRYEFDCVAGTGDPIYVRQDDKTEVKEHILAIYGADWRDMRRLYGRAYCEGFVNDEGTPLADSRVGSRVQ